MNSLYKKVSHLIALIFITFILSSTSNAALVFFDNPNQFSGSEILVTFDDLGLSSSEEITSAGDVDFSLLTTDTLIDTGFSPTLASAPNSTYQREFLPNDGPKFLKTINHSTAFFVDLKIGFAETINLVGAEIRSRQTLNDADTIGFELYFGSTLVGQETMAIRGQDDFFFYGFSSTIAFDSLVVRQRPDSRLALENLRFEPSVTLVPEPNTLILMMLTLVCVMFFRINLQRRPK